MAKTQEHAKQVPLTEEQFLRQVLAHAKLKGWRAYHVHDSRKVHFHADSRGFPDLVLVRDCIVYAELKREGGKATPTQVEWLDALDEAGAIVRLWQPSDWPEIEGLLT